MTADGQRPAPTAYLTKTPSSHSHNDLRAIGSLESEMPFRPIEQSCKSRVVYGLQKEDKDIQKTPSRQY